MLLFGADASDQQHERTLDVCPRLPVDVEVGRGRLLQRAWRKRSKRLTVLDFGIQRVLHGGVRGVSQDAARPERTRPELHASLEPADDIVLRQQTGHGGCDCSFG